MRAAGAVLMAALAASGCSMGLGEGDFSWVGGEPYRPASRGALRVNWRKSLTRPVRGAYVPIETAVPALDAKHGRVYVGSASKSLYAFSYNGTLLYRIELDARVESEPALDVERDELYLGTERGDLHAFTPSKGLWRWRAETQGAIRQQPLLTDDAIYVVTEADVVEAFARKDGSPLWRYKRDPLDGFAVAGHAGIALHDGRILAAFNDGTVASLDAVDGSVRWERPTSLDVPATEDGLPEYLDVDTTPVVVGDTVYAASFGAGLYALDVQNGSVRWRMEEATGVTGILALPDGHLILASANSGLSRLDPATQERIWNVPNARGSLGQPILVRDYVLVGRSAGSLLSIRIADGSELSRVDAGHGFSALPAVQSRRAFVVSNGGALLALRLNR